MHYTKRMRGQQGSTILVVALILLITGLGTLLTIRPWQHASSNKAAHIATTPVTLMPASNTFTGIVSADSCASTATPAGDVGCSITVGTIVVQVEHGNTHVTVPWGSVLGAQDLSKSLVGKTVRVYAHRLSATQYDLAGSSSYYAELLH